MEGGKLAYVRGRSFGHRVKKKRGVYLEKYQGKSSNLPADVLTEKSTRRMHG